MCGKTAKILLKATDEVVLYRLFQQSGCSGENVMGGTGMEVAAKGKVCWAASADAQPPGFCSRIFKRDGENDGNTRI